MDSVIVAAGFGSRLRSVAKSKPLAEICGISLIEIAALQLARAGIRRIFVVTGYKADEIEAVLPAVAIKAGVEIESVRVDDWTLPNGYSVMAGARRVSGDYILVMADHILDSGIFDSLRAAHTPANGVVLGIDLRMDSPLIDPEDATYVRRDDANNIVKIGKDIVDADSVDCGAFYATSGLADAIAAAIADGKPGSLSDGMQRLADDGKAMALDIGQQWWIDVDDPNAHAIAQRELPDQLPHLFGL